MANNLEYYERFKAVPDGACKPFDNGKFKGTDINSMWRIKCLTEAFGVVGFGWTMRVIRTWTEAGANGEIMAFAEIGLKIKVNGEWSEEFTATGGNTMVKYVKSKDAYTNSDEAFKMAITDAFGVACKYIGIGADIYWANDKSKYTEYETKAEKGITASQKKEMEELGILEANVCKYYSVKSIDELTEKQAQFVINAKKGAKNG